jgi:protein involved in polysaccharide export with SLBB domain
VRAAARRRCRVRTTGSSTGDKLSIEVYKDEQLSQSLQIRPDGKITLPLVGDVTPRARRPSELRDTLAEPNSRSSW